MHALVVYCHPSPKSFTAAVRDVVLEELAQAGAETTVIDLYAEGFDAILSRDEWEGYEAATPEAGPLAPHVAALRAADTLIFVYPTWWYGLPAMIKGWLDRAMLPGVAFALPPPEGGDIKPLLTHIQRLGVFTTCGASWRLTRFVGSPGRRTILRGFRLLCHPMAHTAFSAHYLMDSSSPESRAAHLVRVRRNMRRLIAGRGGLLRRFMP